MLELPGGMDVGGVVCAGLGTGGGAVEPRDGLGVGCGGVVRPVPAALPRPALVPPSWIPGMDAAPGACSAGVCVLVVLGAEDRSYRYRSYWRMREMSLAP